MKTVNIWRYGYDAVDRASVSNTRCQPKWQPRSLGNRFKGTHPWRRSYKDIFERIFMLGSF